MSRALLLALAVFALCPAAARADNPSAAASEPDSQAGSLGWNDPQHRLFFNYQRYLVKIGLKGQTPATWSALSRAARLKRVEEDEAFLKKKLSGVLAQQWLSPEDEALIEAVWGKALVEAVKKTQAAGKNGQQTRIDEERKAVAALAQKIGGIKGNWKELFDNQKNGSGEAAVLLGEKKPENYLEVKSKQDFLDSLKSKEVQDVLASQESFEKFLKQHELSQEVSAQALPGLSAMYLVLKSAKGDEKAQLDHILPTAVRLILDGKRVTFDPTGPSGAYGLALPGPYDAPEGVVVTPAVIGADPIVVGKTLAHELQHIYDMYTGRYYTLDSEMRGFKTAVLYFQVLKKEHLDKYNELKSSLNKGTRDLISDVEDYTAEYYAGPQKFRDAVAARYTRREEGVFEGRMSLSETIDPHADSSAPRDLAMAQARRDKTQAKADALEARQSELRAQIAKRATRDLEHQLEAVIMDLDEATKDASYWKSQANIKELRLRRMQSEWEWHKRQTSGGTDPYDLSLPVDKEYALP